MIFQMLRIAWGGRLPKDVFHFAQQGTALRLVLKVYCAFQFLQQFALPFVQFAGSLDAKFDEQIAFAMTVEHWHAFAADAHGRTRLHSLGNFQGVLAFEGGDANLGSERSLAERNWNHAVQIGALAFKEGMLLDVQNHIKIARRSAESPSLAQTGEADAGAVFHSRGNFGFDRPLPQNPALAFALGAGIGDDAARALTGRAGPGHAEKSLLVAHLSAASAGAAGDRRFAGSSPRTAAVFTGLVTPDGNLRLLAEHGFLELQSDVLAQVGAALRPRAPARTSAEEIAEAKEVAENLTEVVKDAGIDARRPSNSAYAGVSEAVVGGSLVGIRQNRVGFAALFELVFRVRIVGIAIRVKLQRQLAVGTLDFLLAGSAGNPEDLVVIAFYVASQNKVFAFLRNVYVNV